MGFLFIYLFINTKSQKKLGSVSCWSLLLFHLQNLMKFLLLVALVVMSVSVAPAEVKTAAEAVDPV